MHVDAEGKETKEGEAGVHPTRRSFFCSKHLSKKTFSKKDLPIYHRALDTRTQSECDTLLATMSPAGQATIERLGKACTMPAYAPHAIGTTTVSSPAESGQNWLQYHGIRRTGPFNGMRRICEGMHKMFLERCAAVARHKETKKLLTPRGLDRLEKTRQEAIAFPSYNVVEQPPTDYEGKF